MKKLIPLVFALILIMVSACDLEKIEPGGGGGTITPFSTHFSLGNDQIVYVESVVEAVDGGFIVSGTTVNINNSIEKLFIVKTSITGSVEKVKTDFNFLGNLYGGKLIRTTDDHYAIVGREYTGSDYRIVVVKLKPDLSIVWNKFYTYSVSGNEDRGHALVEAGDGSYIVAASTTDGTKEVPYFVKVRADNGAETANKRIDFANPGIYRPVSITRNGNSYGILGYNFGISIPPPFFLKLDQNLGALINNPLNELGNGDGEIVANSTDGFAICSGVSSQLLQEAYVLDLTGNGVETRFDLFSSAAKSGCYGLSRSSSGQFVPAGWTAVSSNSNAVAAAALLSSSYSTQFSYTHSEEPSSFRASSPVSDGGFVFAGSFGTGEEVLLVKLDKELKLN
jgi:hypothetical protein